MKQKLFSSLLLILISGLALLISGCPSPLDGTRPTDISPEPTVTVDPARGVAVMTESDGSETVISSVEDGEAVDCLTVTDYVIFNSDDSGRHASGGYGPRAIILGVRSDGRPGVWIVYYGGIVIVPEGDGSDRSSELLEAVSEADGFRWDNGWDYTAGAISGDGRIIVGTAENSGAHWLADYLGSTPKVVVWWNLYETEKGVFYLSPAKVVAEYPEWDFHEVRYGRRGHFRYRYLYRWLYRFFTRYGLWFYAWADDYLGDLATGDDLGDTDPVEVYGDGTYGIYGYDKEGDFALATIKPHRIVEIEKTDPPGNDPPDPPVNRPPWPVTGPAQEVLGEGGSFRLTVTGDSGDITDPSQFDPDGDKVTYTADRVGFDNTNTLYQPKLEIDNSGFASIVLDDSSPQDGGFDWSTDFSGYSAFFEISATDENGLSAVSTFTIEVLMF